MRLVWAYLETNEGKLPLNPCYRIPKRKKGWLSSYLGQKNKRKDMPQVNKDNSEILWVGDRKWKCCQRCEQESQSSVFNNPLTFSVRKNKCLCTVAKSSGSEIVLLIHYAKKWHYGYSVCGRTLIISETDQKYTLPSRKKGYKLL